MYTRTVINWQRSLVLFRDSFDCGEDTTYHVSIVFLTLLMGADSAHRNFEKYNKITRGQRTLIWEFKGCTEQSHLARKDKVLNPAKCPMDLNSELTAGVTADSLMRREPKVKGNEELRTAVCVPETLCNPGYRLSSGCMPISFLISRCVCKFSFKVKAGANLFF